MTEPILSFNDYRSHLGKKLRSLRHFERCMFSAWCAEYLLARYAGPLRRELSSSEVEALQTILDVIWQHLLDGSIPARKVLNELDESFLEIESDDSFTTELHPILINVKSAIGLCILSCRRNNVSLAQEVGETVISVLDQELDERDPGYSGRFNRMFENPDMQLELEAQLAMIKHLQGDYSLDQQLRKAFR